MRMSTIYGWKDPRDGQLYYVGVTGNLKQRTSVHNAYARRGSSAPLYQWIRKLWAEGVSPTVCVLEEVPDEQARNREEFLIEQLASQGVPLTNQQVHSGYPLELVERSKVLTLWDVSY